MKKEKLPTSGFSLGPFSAQELMSVFNTRAEVTARMAEREAERLAAFDAKAEAAISDLECVKGEES